jgi:hypothetical protein
VPSRLRSISLLHTLTRQSFTERPTGRDNGERLQPGRDVSTSCSGTIALTKDASRQSPATDTPSCAELENSHGGSLPRIEEACLSGGCRLSSVSLCRVCRSISPNRGQLIGSPFPSAGKQTPLGYVCRWALHIILLSSARSLRFSNLIEYHIADALRRSGCLWDPSAVGGWQNNTLSPR